MALAARQALTVFRNDPLHLALRIEGVDLTSKTFGFAVRAYPAASGSALMALANTAVAGTEGIRLLGVETDDDGIHVSLVEIIANKLTIQNLPASPLAGEDLALSYDFQVSGLPIDDGFVSPEVTLMFGDFIVRGSVND